MSETYDPDAYLRGETSPSALRSGTGPLASGAERNVLSGSGPYAVSANNMPLCLSDAPDDDLTKATFEIAPHPLVADLHYAARDRLTAIAQEANPLKHPLTRLNEVAAEIVQSHDGRMQPGEVFTAFESRLKSGATR